MYSNCVKLIFVYYVRAEQLISQKYRIIDLIYTIRNNICMSFLLKNNLVMNGLTNVV